MKLHSVLLPTLLFNLASGAAIKRDAKSYQLSCSDMPAELCNDFFGTTCDSNGNVINVMTPGKPDSDCSPSTCNCTLEAAIPCASDGICGFGAAVASYTAPGFTIATAVNTLGVPNGFNSLLTSLTNANASLISGTSALKPATDQVHTVTTTDLFTTTLTLTGSPIVTESTPPSHATASTVTALPIGIELLPSPQIVASTTTSTKDPGCPGMKTVMITVSPSKAVRRARDDQRTASTINTATAVHSGTPHPFESGHHHTGRVSSHVSHYHKALNTTSPV